MFFFQWDEFINLIAYPPGSLIFILLLSTAVALISTALTKWLTDTKAIQRKQLQIKAHNEEKQKIVELAQVDIERYRKQRKRWERKDEMLKKSQQNMALQRMKPTCITFVPMLIIFALVRMIFLNNPVAITPMNANDVPFIGNFLAGFTDVEYAWTALVYGNPRIIPLEAGWINFTAWYFLCSLGINTLIQRLFKLQTQATGGMEQMFGGTKAKAIEFPDV